MKTILVIEDNALTAKVIKAILEANQYQVSVAENGKEGVLLLRRTHVDLVLTDMYMPIQDGLETIKIIQSEFPQIRIIAMSTGIESGNADYLREAQTIGAHAILTKPIKKLRLLAVVETMLQGPKKTVKSTETASNDGRPIVLFIDERKTDLIVASHFFHNTPALTPFHLITCNLTLEVPEIICDAPPSYVFIEQTLIALPVIQHSIFNPPECAPTPQIIGIMPEVGQVSADRNNAIHSFIQKPLSADKLIQSLNLPTNSGSSVL